MQRDAARCTFRRAAVGSATASTSSKFLTVSPGFRIRFSCADKEKQGPKIPRTVSQETNLRNASTSKFRAADKRREQAIQRKRDSASKITKAAQLRSAAGAVARNNELREPENFDEKFKSAEARRCDAD